MTITFKRFLNETAVETEPAYSQLTRKQAMDLLKKHCSDSLWMIETGHGLFRGDYTTGHHFSATGFSTVDTSATKRKSTNTTNYYTEIFDNIPSRKEFPKRSRSFIGTTNKNRVFGGWNNNSGFAMIPFNGVKVGFVNSADMWDTRVTILGKSRVLDVINDIWHSVIQHDSNHIWESFKELATKLKDDDQAAISKRTSVAAVFDVDENANEFKVMCDDLLRYLDDKYSPIATGHEYFSTRNLRSKLESIKNDSEIWVSGKCVLIKNDMWDELVGKNVNNL